MGYCRVDFTITRSLFPRTRYRTLRPFKLTFSVMPFRYERLLRASDLQSRQWQGSVSGFSCIRGHPAMLLSLKDVWGQ